MAERMLHVFRNTPLGRETLLQSLHFCKTLSVALHIYIPVSRQFLMYFEHDMIQIDLDASYLISTDNAESHARALAEPFGIKPYFIQPKNYTAAQLPDIPIHFDYMCCPRGIIDLSAKIGLGYIGPKVRRIIKSSIFPILMTSGVYKAWHGITVFYGGSSNAETALRWGVHLSEKSGRPLDLFTYADIRNADRPDARLQASGLWDRVRPLLRTWHKIDQGGFKESLYAVDHDALLVVGAYGHGLLKDFVYGSKMEVIQRWMPNNMLLIGPHCVSGN